MAHVPPSGGAAPLRLDALFHPGNVAVIGASQTPGKQGHTAVRNLKKAGFAGGIFPVNPAGGEIDGIPVLASIGEVPARIDCALMVIPAAASVEAVRACAAAGVRSLVIGSTGYAELGTDEGRARQSEIVAIARASGMRIVGPNTNGIYNASGNFSLGYNTSHGEPLAPGPVSIVAHSGALFNSVAPRLRHIGAGLSKFVPVGNEADLTMLDFLEYLLDDPETGVIGLIIEGISDGGRFRALAERARAAGKPIVALKLGRSRAGAGATEAHSSRLAGSARAFDALFREVGIASVPTVEALAGACGVLLATRSRAADTSLVCVSSTGGGASMLADFAAARGLALAGNPDGSWSGSIAQTIAGFTGAGTIRNPTDTGSLGGSQRMETLFQAQEREGYSGPVVLYTHNLPRVEASLEIARMMIARQHRTGSPVLVVAPGGLAEPVVERYKANRLPFFLDLSTAFDSLQAYFDTAPGNAPESPVAEPLPESVARALEAKSGVLSEIESAEVLRGAGIPVVESRTVGSPAEAIAAAEELGWPVVLKALVPGVAHKNRLGLVAPGLLERAQLEAAYGELARRAAALGHGRAPLLVQPMVKAQAELIVGLSWEEPLGHFLLVGLGGIHAEALDEVTLFPVPIAGQSLRRRLAQSRVGRLLASMDAPSRAGELVDALLALQRLALRHGDRIHSIDVNPLLVTATRCVAVDALVIVRNAP